MITKGQLIQPLTLDLKAFKARYKQLSGLTSYERANAIASERKRAAWAAYRPLKREQLYDSGVDMASVTILSPMASRAPKRSTHNGLMYANTTVVRTTEILAILHALGLFKFDAEDPVIRQDPGKVLWYCIECHTFKPLTEFAAEKHNVHGLSFACKRCEREAQQVTWKKAA
jgi:hypothetical protein